MTEVLPSVLVLTVMALVALWLTISRGGVTGGATAVQPAVRIAAIAIAAQAGHFAEELTTGFHGHLTACRRRRRAAARPALARYCVKANLVAPGT